MLMIIYMPIYIHSVGYISAATLIQNCIQLAYMNEIIIAIYTIRCNIRFIARFIYQLITLV